jgi:hypothetical protein
MFMLLEWNWASIVFLTIWSMYWALVERTLVSLEADTTLPVEALFCHCPYFWLSEAGVPLVLF